MAVFYRLAQVTSPDSQSKLGYWYGRAVAIDTVTTDDLAEIIQTNCTVKKSDVKAVLTELVEVMTDQLQSSKKVRLDGFGSFKVGINTIGAEKASNFSASKNVKNVHINFTPELHIDANGRSIKTFLDGITMAELPKNAVTD